MKVVHRHVQQCRLFHSLHKHSLADHLSRLHEATLRQLEPHMAEQLTTINPQIGNLMKVLVLIGTFECQPCSRPCLKSYIRPYALTCSPSCLRSDMLRRLNNHFPLRIEPHGYTHECTHTCTHTFKHTCTHTRIHTLIPKNNTHFHYPSWSQTHTHRYMHTYVFHGLDVARIIPKVNQLAFCLHAGNVHYMFI